MKIEAKEGFTFKRIPRVLTVGVCQLAMMMKN